MLDVDRGDHVDPGVEQFLDVLPALLVPRARHVGVRQLVHQGDLRPPGQHRVQVHLLEGRAAVLQPGPGDDLQAVQQRAGLRAPVRLGEPHDDVGAALGPAVPLAEHGEGLAHPGRGSEIDPQVPAGRPGFGNSARTGGCGAGTAGRPVLLHPAGVQPPVLVSHLRPVSLPRVPRQLLLAAADFIVKHGHRVRHSACQDGQPGPNEIHAPRIRDPYAARLTVL